MRKSAGCLPKSPRKKKAVICGLAKKAGIEIKTNTTPSANPGHSLTETEKVVKDFYVSMDISYTAPGMKDEITVWVNGVKQKLRKYFLKMHVKEAHALFQERYPNHTISFSAFAKLRPPNVLLLKNTPADQCKCLQHENFMLKLAGLGKTDNNEWWGKVLCDPEKLHDKCWKAECDVCGKTLVIDEFKDSDKSKDVTWMEWVKEDNGRLKKVMKFGCQGELEELVEAGMSDFQEHVRVKRIQALAFEKAKQQKTVIEMDFAMSYSCEYQNEVQSALWSRESVMLFTAAIFQNGSCESHVIVSNSNDKGKDSVFAFVNYRIWSIKL